MRSWLKRFLVFELLFLAIAACAAAILGWLTEEVFEGETRAFDSVVQHAVHHWTPPWFTTLMRFFTDVGSPLIVVLLTAGIVVFFYRAGWVHDAVTVLLAMGGAVLLTEALKLTFHRARPTPYFGILAPHSFSYPSGHALAAFTFYATIAYILSVRVRSSRSSAAIWTAAVLLIACIGFSRIYLGVHYPTDVAAGYLVAFAWVSALAAGHAWHLRRHSDRTQGG
jgi:undecaprenyl-diphosphatase